MVVYSGLKECLLFSSVDLLTEHPNLEIVVIASSRKEPSHKKKIDFLFE